MGDAVFVGFVKELAVELLLGYEFDVLLEPLPDCHVLEVLGVGAAAQRQDVGGALGEGDCEDALLGVPSRRGVAVGEREPERLDVLPVVAATELEDGDGVGHWPRIGDRCVGDRARRSAVGGDAGDARGRGAGQVAQRRGPRERVG